MRKMAVALVLLGALVGTGCAGSIRIYDEPRRDYHQWNRGEERSYRFYMTERHRGYVEYKRLDRRDQDDYWFWRHDHPDRDDSRGRDNRRP